MLAVAPEKKVNQAISELLDDGTIDTNAILVSTKAYRHAKLSAFEDIDLPSLSEEVVFDFGEQARVIVIQYNLTTISYINIYRFLRANRVSSFDIKVAGSPIVQQSAESIFAQFTAPTGASNDSVFWVSPEEIKVRHEFPPAIFGVVKDGDWDQETEPFEQSVSFFESLKLRHQHNKPWNETPYYHDVMASLNRGESRFGCRSSEQFLQKLDEIETLYEDIKQNGWQQRDGSDYVSINIGRDGQLIFNDGRHRLSIAKVLGLSEIPVKIAVRHAKWMEFKGEILSFAERFYNGKVYANLSHPDLREIPCAQEETRLELILSNTAYPAGTVLDIGSHWGYFCVGLEKAGHTCTAIEADVANYYFLDKIKRAEQCKFKAVCASVFDFVNSDIHVDTVLALNIFHHFLKTEAGHANLVSLLGRLNFNEMFLQTHSPQEPQMEGSYKNYAGEEFAEFVMQHSGASKMDVLKRYDTGRIMFRLSK